MNNCLPLAPSVTTLLVQVIEKTRVGSRAVVKHMQAHARQLYPVYTIKLARRAAIC